MGILSTLRKAISSIGEFDNRVAFGSDYKEKAAALAQLNDLNIRAKLLDNEGKFQLIQRMRQQQDVEDRKQRATAFTQAATLGALQDPQYNPDYQGLPNPGSGGPNLDQIDPTNILHKGGEDIAPTEIPSFLAPDIAEQDRPLLDQTVRKAQSAKATADERAQVKFDNEQRGAALGDRVKESQIIRNLRPPASGGGGAPHAVKTSDVFRTGPDGQLEHGTKIIMSDGSVREDFGRGSIPEGAVPSQQNQNTLFGYAQSVNNLQRVINDFQKVRSDPKLGPLVGRMANLNAAYLGGQNLSKDQRILLGSIDRAKTLAAFAEGGKQLTGNEKKYFDENYPTLEKTDDPEIFLGIAQRLIDNFRSDAVYKWRSMPLNRRPDVNQMRSLGFEIGAAGPGVTGSKGTLADWLKSQSGGKP